MRRYAFAAPLLFALVWLLGACGSTTAAGADAGPYARPGRLVALPDGRKLNLRCSGGGSPTVLLESGYGADAGAWFKVQPELARMTRVCSYDRAGYGFSDPGPLPRDGAAIARDLDQGLKAAGIRGPFIVVGHSAGGLYARLFAARRVKDIEGLILLEPTVERRAPRPAGDGLDGIRRRVQRCLGVTEASPGDPASNPDWTGCVSGKTEAHTAAMLRTPDPWRQRLSELDEIFGRTSDEVFRLGGLLRPTPLYVITSSETAAASPTAGGVAGQPSLWEIQHQLLSGQSENGSQQTVVSSHLVMIDRPDVVVRAVQEMVRAARENRPPPLLPLSETAAPRPDSFGTPEPEKGPFDAASRLEPFAATK